MIRLLIIFNYRNSNGVKNFNNDDRTFKHDENQLCSAMATINCLLTSLGIWLSHFYYACI